MTYSPTHIVKSKIMAFRRQGFRVSVRSAPSVQVSIEDDHRNYLTLTSSDAMAFVSISRYLAEKHALSLADAYRLQAFRALQAHLQIELPLELSRRSKMDPGRLFEYRGGG